MIIRDAKQFEKLITEFVEAQKKSMTSIGGKIHIDDLHEALNSPDAVAFTARMNQLYIDKGINDDAGNPLTIKHPTELSSKIRWEADGQSGTFSVTDEEDRWIRANQLYGSNILGKLGFKYTNG